MSISGPSDPSDATSTSNSAPNKLRYEPRSLRAVLSASPLSPTSTITPVSQPGLLKKTSTFAFLAASPHHQSPNRRKSLKPSQLDDFAKLTQLNTVVRPGNPHVFNAPAFKPIPFGKAWYSDIIVLFTNAIRFETKSLFFLLYCLHERSNALEEGDILSFFVWFEPYHNFICLLFDLIHDKFLPWVESRADLPESSPRSFFLTSGAALKRVIQKTLSHKNTFVSLRPSRAAAKLRHIYSTNASLLLEYLTKLEDACSPIIENQYTVQDCRLMSRQMVVELAKAPNFSKNAILLLRWLHKRPQTAATWRRENFDFKTMMSYSRWRRRGPPEECLSYFANKCKAIPRHMDTEML